MAQAQSKVTGMARGVIAKPYGWAVIGTMVLISVILMLIPWRPQ